MIESFEKKTFALCLLIPKRDRYVKEVLLYYPSISCKIGLPMPIFSYAFRNVQDWKCVYPPEFRILKSYRNIAFQNLFSSPSSENLYATNQTPVVIKASLEARRTVAFIVLSWGPVSREISVSFIAFVRSEELWFLSNLFSVARL